MVVTEAQTCSHCGELVSPGARFCAKCGSDISGQQGGVATVHVDASPFGTMNQAGLLEALRQATLGEYELMGELGRGGMATVYLAHDIALDRKVAIKVMSPQLMSGEGMAERFKREARTAGALSHPHIIPIYAVKESGQLLYFVMKFVEGRPLDSIIKEVGQLPIPMVQTILQQVGSALGYAHRRGVVHRDIKPANIMLDAEGWAVVTDFGIAKVSEKQGLTMTGATMGTPSYMSPEQCAAKELTGASDQYSLGVVAWEMLAGKLPFVAESVMAVMYAHYNEPPPPIQNVRADCPPEIAGAIMRMLEKDPAARFPNIEAAVAAIGGAPLAPDDPVRTQMMTLAAAGDNLKMMSRFSTPISKPPGSRSGGTSTSGRQSVASIVISPMQVTTTIGAAVQLLATPKARTGATIANKPVTWASTNTDVAKVSSSGLVTAIGPGVVTITASTETTSTTATITVTAERAGRRKLLSAIAAVLLLAVGAGAYLFGPWSAGHKEPEAGNTAAPPESTAHVAAAPATTPPAAPVESTAHQPTGGGTPPTSRPPSKPAAPTTPAGPSQQDIQEAEAARATAQRAHDRAVGAGATALDLSNGDDEIRTGDQLVAGGQPRAAVAHFANAGTSYDAAATKARSKPPEPAPAAAAVTPPVDQRPQIQTVVQSQLRAISQAFAARDLKQLQNSYPGIGADKLEGFKEFFKNASEVTAVLTPGAIDWNGDQAEVPITETLHYRDGEGKHDVPPQSLRAHLERQPNGTWRITSIE